MLYVLRFYFFLFIVVFFFLDKKEMDKMPLILEYPLVWTEKLGRIGPGPMKQSISSLAIYLEKGKHNKQGPYNIIYYKVLGNKVHQPI